MYLFVRVGFLCVDYNFCFLTFNAKMLTLQLVVYCDVTVCAVIR